MNKLPDISIVIPVFNEEPNLNELINRCLKVCHDMSRQFELILVDDGSTDNSTDMINKAVEENSGKIIGVLLNRNYGQHSAIMAGFSNASGNIVVTLDADLQNPPEEIPKLIEKIEEGFDVVGCVRKYRADTLFRKTSSLFINRLVRMCTGVVMHDYGCMLRAYSRTIVDAMLLCREGSTFIPVLANSFAKNTTEIKVKHNVRNAGDSKYSIWKLINLQFDLLTSITTTPLRMLSLLGAGVSSVGFGLGVYIMVMRLTYGSAWSLDGVFTLFAILFVFMGIQFVGMALLGEYIGRIYNDVRNRPRYFVQNIVGKKTQEIETGDELQ